MDNTIASTKHTNKTQVNPILLLVGVVIAFMFLSAIFQGIFSDSDATDLANSSVSENRNQDEDTLPIEEENTDVDVAEVAEESDPVVAVKYEIYKESVERYDDAKSYYLYVDISTDKITTQDVKNVIDNIAKTKKEAKFSLVIFNDVEALNAYYNKYKNMEVWNTDKINQYKSKLIATYDRGLEALGPDAIMMFPSAFSDDPDIGNRVEYIEYTPTK